MDLSPPAPIRADQLPSVLDLIARCYRGYHLTLNLADECEQHLADPGAYFRAHAGEFWVRADADGLARATSALYLHNPHLAELKSLYVDPDLRRRGLGREMTLLVLSEARRRGCREIELWSDTRFTAAHALYESLGFTRTDRRDIHDSNNSSEWGYRMPL